MKKQFNLLQVYRGFAALLVVLSHGENIINRELHQDSLLNMFTFGWVGVDFFFVLSGFIIFYVHQSDIGQVKKFKPFIIKRFLRIYLIYWIVLLVKIFATYSNQYKLSEIFKAILLIPMLESDFIGVSWTLSYEILFYLVFSALILKPKLSIPIIIAWIIGISLNFTNIIQLPQENFLLQFFFSNHNLEFVFGCLAAYLISKYNIYQGMLIMCISLFLLTVSVINTTHLAGSTYDISRIIAYGIPFTMLIIASVSIEQSKSINIPYILIYLGDASYSIYLTHGFFMSNVSKIIQKYIEKFNFISLGSSIFIDYIIVLIILGVTIGCGCIIHSYVEKPLNIFFRKKLLPKSG